MSPIVETLLNGQSTNQRPFTSKSPLPYHWIPGEIRFWLSKVLFAPHAKNIRKQTQRAPANYLDNAVDIALRQDFSNRSKPFWSWPSQKSCALVLSSDTDSSGQEKGIQMLMAVGRKRGLTNTISFVGQDIPHYEPLIKELRTDGIDVALHDVVHDNQIAFLTPEEIIERLKVVNRFREQYDIRGFRSPSWYVSPSLWKALDSLHFIYDMSALDTWSIFSKEENYGVRTFFPFMVQSLTIIPNTIPFELPWYLGYSVNQTFDFWKPKFDFIAQSGGLIMFNAHPDRWFCGNVQAIRQLEQCLDYILANYSPALMSARNVAQHTQQMLSAGALLKLSDAPLIYTPNHPMGHESEQVRINPCHYPPRQFMEQIKCA